MKILKRALLAGGALALCINTPGFGAEIFWFDPDGPGPEAPIQVGAFDWAQGNALAAGGIPLGFEPTSFTLLSHSFLANFSFGGAPVTGTGLNIDYEYTIVVGFPETGVAVGGASAEFDLASDGPNFVEVYFDTARNSDMLEGSGFADGQLILRAVVKEAAGSFTQFGTTTLLDQFGPDNFGGQQSVRGAGGTRLVAQVVYANPEFFVGDTLPLELTYNTNQIVPFTETNPSRSFVGTSRDNGHLSVLPQVGSVNGTSGPDMLLQVDATMSLTLGATKSGYKFNDLNGNGAWDVGEPGLADWTIYIDLNGNGVLDAGEPTALTDENGHYQFDGLPAGTYVFREVLQDGWTCTFPDPCYYEETLAEGQVSMHNDFGNYREQFGQCRMTGGHVTVNQDYGTLDYVEGTYALVEQPAPVTKGKPAPPPRYTIGGQVGAPQANDPSYGEWNHTQHDHPIYGSFSFHAGTASASPGTEISSITCTDPGWCVQARCAPFKQIFWDGVGEFQNIKSNAGWLGGVSCSVVPPSQNKKNPGTKHYFRAHVGDFGEPGGNFIGFDGPQPSEEFCTWMSGGLDPFFTVLIDQVPDPKFASKGGQACENCPDWYEIEIHCTADPASPVIYRVRDFIDRGNLQIHPEVGQSCPW